MSNIEDLIKLTNPFKEGVNWVQSAGGNISVKSGDLMHIKASGFRLSQISKEKGFVKVDVPKVKDYFTSAKEESILVKEYKPHITDCIVGDDSFLPSMETGFHAVLDKYVVHTHPMLLNVLLCSSNAREAINKLGINYTYVPYVTPGFQLSKAIANSNKISVIFLENHGLITHSDDLDNAIRLHQLVLEKIKLKTVSINYLNYSKKAPDKFVFKDNDALLKNILPSDLDNYLFPDQAVFLHGKVSFMDENSTIFINLKTCEIIYNMSEKSASSCHEVLYSTLWIIAVQKNNGLKPAYLSEIDSAEILGLDMEKYRQSL